MITLTVVPEIMGQIALGITCIKETLTRSFNKKHHRPSLIKAIPQTKIESKNKIVFDVTKGEDQKTCR